jgi:hypothetical protein
MQLKNKFDKVSMHGEINFAKIDGMEICPKPDIIEAMETINLAKMELRNVLGS